MRVTNDLFFLIKSLSPVEKRYFRLYSELHSKSKEHNYIRLFDAIDKQTSYDENAIKQKFRNETFVKQLTVTKNKLSSKLLESLRSYQAGSKTKDVTFQLRESLDTLTILKKRKAFNQMYKELRRAKKLAYQHDAFSYLLLLGQFEMECFMDRKGEDMLDGLNQLLEEEQEILQQLQNQQAYTNLNNKVFISFKLKIGAEQKQQTALKRLLNHDLLKEPEHASSFQAKVYFHNIRAYCFIRIKNFETAYEHYNTVKALWEAHPVQIDRKPLGYIKALCNYLNGCYQTERHALYPETLSKLKEIEVKYKIKESDFIHTRLLHELMYYLVTGNLKEGQLAAPSIDKTIEANKAHIHISRQMAIYYNLMILYFFCDDHSNCLTQLIRLNNLPKNNPRTDIRHFCKLLLIVVHYELGNIDLLHNLCRSAQRTLSNPSVFEKLLLTNLTALDQLDIWSKSDRQQFFIDFKDDITSHAQTNKSYVLGLEEIRFWLESKIQNQTLETVYVDSIENNN